jgi:hypothetical protein
MAQPRPVFPRRDCLKTLACASLAVLASARASALPRPTGATVLTVTGVLTEANGSAGAEFDMAMLALLPQRVITTRTPWFDGARRFTGPRLRDVLAAAGATGRVLQATALNDYRVEIPVDDVMRHDVVLARLLDDRPMPVREKGPLFVIYPFDEKPELATQVHFSRCIWQLRSIAVR